MTDTNARELVERLQIKSGVMKMGELIEWGSDTALMDEAAAALSAALDRAEALESERDEALNQLDSARHSVDVLEKRVAEARREDTQAREIMAKTIGELLTRVDEAYAPPEGHLSMHTYGQTPDWFVEAAYQACYAKPTEHAIAEHRVALIDAPAPAPAQPSVRDVERERIATELDTEADMLPCTEDANVVRSCVRLVRANFSYEEAERLYLKDQT